MLPGLYNPAPGSVVVSVGALLFVSSGVVVWTSGSDSEVISPSPTSLSGWVVPISRCS